MYIKMFINFTYFVYFHKKKFKNNKKIEMEEREEIKEIKKIENIETNSYIINTEEETLPEIDKFKMTSIFKCIKLNK